MASGIDYNKLCLLIAVLEKRAGIILTNYDAYLNVAGGIKLSTTRPPISPSRLPFRRG